MILCFFLTLHLDDVMHVKVSNNWFQVEILEILASCSKLFVLDTSLPV